MQYWALNEGGGAEGGEGWREVIRLMTGWGASRRWTGCELCERAALPSSRSPQRGTAGTHHLSLVKVAYDDLVQRLLQLAVGLGVLLARLHDL